MLIQYCLQNCVAAGLENNFLGPKTDASNELAFISRSNRYRNKTAKSNFFCFFSAKKKATVASKIILLVGAKEGVQSRMHKNTSSLCVFLPLFVVSAEIEKMLCGTIFASKLPIF